MLKIAVTLPDVICGEVVIIRRLLAEGIDIIHLRKPNVDIDYCRYLLEELTPSQRSRIVVHNHYELYEEFKLRGVPLTAEAAMPHT